MIGACGVVKRAQPIRANWRNLFAQRSGIYSLPPGLFIPGKILAAKFAHRRSSQPALQKLSSLSPATCPLRVILLKC
jgi:hypothetical protein